MSALLDRLREIGLGDYEARLYLALVQRHPATGYELARASGVPSSKVYEVLARLQDKDLVFVAEGGKARRYIPVDPEEFVERYTSRMTRTLDGLRDELREAAGDDQVGYIWNVHGRSALLERAAHTIARAEHTLLLSAWDDELAELLEPLAAAHRRKVRTAVVVYGTLTPEAAAVYTHPIRDTIHDEKGGRGLSLCADSRVALVGLAADGGAASGAWSRNHGFVSAVEDYLKHDIYVQKIVGRFNDLLVHTYGRNYNRWRDVFSDRAVARSTSRRPARRRKP
jgi:sugar-specific transcriptional regulator TrmB